MKDLFKHYKKYWENSRKQTQYIKDNWSIDKMAEILNNLLPKIDPLPQQMGLKLPKLNKKLKLPKLKKIEV
jgi:hypothetical protein